MRIAIDEKRFAAAVIVTFAVITLFVTLHHEPWRDEADGWLFARDGTLADFLPYTRHGGTPGLWLLVLMPLAKAGLPYVSQSMLHWAIATASIALLVLRAPMSRLTKLLIVFSYFFSYEYAVIARSYALTILLALTAAALFRKRPIAFAVVVALLFNVNAQGFAIAIAFAILFAADEVARHAYVLAGQGMAIIASGAVAAWLQVRAPADPARTATLHAPIPSLFQWSVGNAFLPTIPPLVGFVAGMIVLLAVTLALRRSREAMLMLWLPIAALSLLYVYVWIGGLRHAGFFLVATILAIWIGGGISRPAALLLNATLVVSCVIAVKAWTADIRQQFSGSREMAEYIASHQLTGEPIAAHNLTQCEALLPYLPGTRFWYAGLGDYGTFLKWNAAFERALDVPYPVAEARARAKFAGTERWLLLFNVEMPDPVAHGFRLLYTNQHPIFDKTDERYWLYAPLR